MKKTISIRLLPKEAANEQSVKEYIAAEEAIPSNRIIGYHLIKQSIDARSRQPMMDLTLEVFIDEPCFERPLKNFDFRDVSKSTRRVVIIGAGPAGLFAALKLIENGIKPILLERGKDVRARRRDLANLNKLGRVNPESNYCFGEGGAGTYSDGKLYTRSSKRGDVNRILHLFVRFGAEESILYNTHPHIGTNKLPQIITAMREAITGHGGEFHFNTRVTGLLIHQGLCTGVRTAGGDTHPGDAFVLATGHSARDIFEMLHSQKLQIEAKPFALGVRVEHPQSLIDAAQYHIPERGPHLPAASYSLVQQVDGKGVFSFCMCPGGIIAPAATQPGELVVNGWSPSRRNNPYANSGIVVTVDPKDAVDFLRNQPQRQIPANDPLLLMNFQRSVEQACYTAGGGELVAPAQRLIDFCEGRESDSLPDCSYLPGIRATMLKDCLPPFIHDRLVLAFREFGRKIRSYYTNDAVIVATESRTSSPVRIPRDPVLLCHPQLSNLYPCAEGAGYAGGIVSAAMDGERVIDALRKVLANS